MTLHGGRVTIKFILSLDSLRADLVQAWRRLRKHRVTSAAAIVSLALAIGACLAAFRLVDALLLRPLPVAAPGRLYALSRQDLRPDGPPSTRDNWQYPLLRDMRIAIAKQGSLIAISGAERAELSFRSDREMERAEVQYASGDMFDTFRLLPAAGRLLSESDDLRPGAHPVAVLSEDYWSRRFARDPHIIGRTFRMTNNLTGTRVYRIVGVVGSGFTGTEPGTVVDIFLPAMMHWGIAYPQWSLFRAFVHLRPGVSPAPVRDHLRAVNQAQGNRSVLEMEPAPAGVSPMQKDYRTPLAALGVLVALVLLIACANVANLMTAQTAARTREIALRISVGAAGRHLAQLVLAEAAIIGVLASALGGFFAAWAAPFVLARVSPPGNPARLSLAVDGRVLAFAFLLTVCITLLFGLLPAFRASITRPVEALKGGAPQSRNRWITALVGLQAAFCLVVLFAAGLFVATLEHLEDQPNGFASRGILNVSVVNPANEPTVLWDQVADHLHALPGVQAVAYADWPILDGRSFKSDAISVEGNPPSETPAWFMNVSPGWLKTLEIPLIAGRDINRNDLSPGVALINDAFAHQFFGNQNPLGKWFTGTSGWLRGQRFQIVGLVGDARYRNLRQSVLPVAYTPFRRSEPGGTMQGGTFVIRTAASNPLALAPILRNEIPRSRPEFRVSDIRTQQELIDSQTIRERLLSLLARFFGAVALLLAAIGLYGVLDYSVFQRRREIGIRMALGAKPHRLAVRVTGRVLSMVLLGSIAGLAFGLASVRYVEPLLYQVRPTAPSQLLIPILTMTGAALLAAVPAVIHAIRIDAAGLLRAG